MNTQIHTILFQLKTRMHRSDTFIPLVRSGVRRNDSVNKIYIHKISNKRSTLNRINTLAIGESNKLQLHEYINKSLSLIIICADILFSEFIWLAAFCTYPLHVTFASCVMNKSCDELTTSGACTSIFIWRVAM